MSKSKRHGLQRLAALVVLALLAGCGGGSGGSGGGGSRGIGNLAGLLNVGDAASDRVVGFALTVNQVQAQQSSGATINLLPAPLTIELMHNNADVTPVALTTTFSEGAYSAVNVTLGGAQLTIVDATGNLLQRTATLTTTSVSIPVSITVATGSAAVVNVEMDLRNSVAIDASNNVTVTPTFAVQLNPAAAAGAQIPETGAIVDLPASVVSVAAPNFTVFVPQAAQQFTFVTGSGTTLNGIGSVGALAAGNIVTVDSELQTNGALNAGRVDAINLNADPLAVQGVVNLVTGAPATSFTMVVQDATAKSATVKPAPNLTTFNVTVGTATFEVDSDEVDLSGLSFTPVFDASTISRLQRVLVSSDTASATAVTAARIRLERQSVTGQITNIVSNSTQAVFDITPGADSAYTLLTGQSTLRVVKQGTTELRNGVSVTIGSVVRARGLMFNNGGSFVLVADRLTTP